MVMKMQSIEEMLAIIKSNPNTLGLVEYGSSDESDNYETGDYDLYVILRGKAHDVESLHFYIGATPVDLNLRSLQEVRSMPFAEGFDMALLDGRIIYDPTTQLSREIEKLRDRQKKHSPREYSEHSIAYARHGHKHVFNKLKGRLNTMPLLCRFLLSTNIYWLVNTYFNVRNIPFRGDKHALNYFKENEPDIYQSIEGFYSAKDLQEQFEISERLTELVLKPVGGQWQDDEILAFGNEETKDLIKKGEKLFQELFMYR